MNLISVESEKLAIMPTSGIVNYFISQQTEGTAKTYFSHIGSFFAWTGAQDYRTISPFQALDYDAYLKATCSPATVQSKIATLKMFFKFAMEAGLIDKNPFALIKQHKVANRVSEKFLVPKEINRLLAELKKAGEREYVLGLLLASTGMRISEVQQLSWSGFILMPDDSICINILRKGGKYQLLPLRQDVWETVHSYMGHRPINQLDKDIPLFLNPSKHRASKVSLRTWIVEAGKRAGIKRYTNPHILRHSFATNSLDNGADIRDVSKYMGHSSLGVTSIYSHPTNMKVGEFLNIKID